MKAFRVIDIERDHKVSLNQMKTANWQSYYIQSPSLPTTFNKNSLHFPFHMVIGFLMKNEVCRNGLFFNQSLLIESKSFFPIKEFLYTSLREEIGQTRHKEPTRVKHGAV